MAKGSKDQTISSVSDIMGFLLDQSKKPPDKRRPIKPDTGSTQSDSEYISTLVEALALPGTFVGDQYLDTLQGLVDPAVKVTTYKDRLGNVKIKASDLPKFFDNPDKFMDELFEKNKPLSNKLEKLKWAGEQMRMLGGSMYARKAELFKDYPPEIRDILIRGVGQTAMQSGQPVDQIWIQKAARELMNKGSLRYSTNDQQVKAFYSMITNPNIKNESGGKIKYNPVEGFRGLLNKEFDINKMMIKGSRELEDLSYDEFVKYKKNLEAQNMLGLWTRSDGFAGSRKGIRKHIAQLKVEEKDFLKQKNAIKSRRLFTTLDGRKLDYRSLSGVDRKKILKDINTRIHEHRRMAGSLRGSGVWAKLGQLEQTWWGMSATFGAGGLSAVLNGTFYDPKYGYFGCPSIKTDLKFGTKADGSDDWKNIKFVKAERKVQNVYGKNDEGEWGWGTKEFKMINTYNNAMVQFYYLNPTTWMKSLFTGEGFAWLADNTRESIGKIFADEGIADEFKVLGNADFWNFYTKYKNASSAERIELLNGNGNYRKLLIKARTFLTKYPNLAKKLEKAQKLAKRFEGLKGVAKFFGRPQRILNWIEKQGAKVTEGLRQKISDVLGKLFSNNEVAKGFLKEWVKLGKGKALTSAITEVVSSFVVKILGAAGTAFGGFVGTVVAIAVGSLLDKIFKVAIKVFIYALVGVFGVIMILSGTRTFNNKAESDGHSREVAGDIQYNESFTGYGGGEDGEYDEGHISPVIVPPPTNSSCPLGDSGYYCTQGYNNTTCSHVNITNQFPVDLAPVTYFYAPQYCDDSPCTATNIVDPGRCDDGNYAGQAVTFDDGNGNVFRMLHVKFIPPSNGRNYKAGEPIAWFYQTFEQLIADDPQQKTGSETPFDCWTGNHVHLTITHNGSYIDPISFLYEMGCNGPSSESQCPACVGKKYE